MKNNMEKKEYQWKTWGNMISRTDVNKVVSELEEIKATHGKINPTLVVEKARDRKSAMHSYFDWDDKSAADAYRGQEASILLRHIEVKVVKDDKPFFVRAYEVLNTSSDNFKSDVKYVSNDSMSPESISIIRKQFMADIGSMIKRMSAFKEFDRAKSYLEWANKILLEDSTETLKEINPALSAAS